MHKWNTATSPINESPDSLEGLHLRPGMKEHGSAAPATGSGLKEIVADGVTGGIEVFITYPAEYVKTQLQLDRKGVSRRYSGIRDCIKKTVQSHGVRGLYRGLNVVLYGSIPKSAVRSGSLETLQRRAVDEKGHLSPKMKGLCALGTGVCEAVFVVTPMETIKVKFISDQRSGNPRFKGFFQGVRLILKEKGFRGVYRGLAATVLKQGSNQGTRVFVVETCMDKYRGGDPNKHVPKILVGAFGALAGAASVLGNAPIDMVKTRMQELQASSSYNGTRDCFVKTWKSEGTAAFYKGTLPRMTRVCLDVAISSMFHDSIIELFNKVWP